MVFHDVPWVGMAQRVQVQPLGHGFWRVTVNFGFMNTPDVPKALRLCGEQGAGRAAVRNQLFPQPAKPSWRGHRGRWPHWRERLFVAMSRNASSVAEFFALPDNAVVELGTRVQI